MGGVLALTLLVLVLFVFCGCAKDPAAVLSWTDTPPPELPDLGVTAPYMAEESVGLEAGDLAPFAGVLLPPETTAYFLASEEMLHHAVGALQQERRYRLNDRSEAEEVVRLLDERWRARLRTERQIAAVAVGGGFVGGVLVTVAVVLAVGAD